MLLSKLKPMEEILTCLKEDKSVFLLGCSGCAQASGSGGPEDVRGMKEKLKAQGKEVSGFTNVDFLCQKALIKSRLNPLQEQVMNADSVLVMSCGIGVQAAAAAINKYCRPACNTLSLGDQRGKWPGQERCRECGDCLLDYTGGICPITKCTKSLLNGACGGAANGKCEVTREMDCGWELIYYRLKELGRLDMLKVYIPPKDYDKFRVAGELFYSALFDIEFKEEEGGNIE